MKRDVPDRYQNAYDRAMSGKSMAAGVKSFCLECVGYDRDEAVACTDHGCPLYPYRPGHSKDPNKPRRTMTPDHLARLALGRTKVIGAKQARSPGEGTDLPCGQDRAL